tara:strand:- start:175 stop:1071 length:897 start_codon:yes stop_codon:yes gene_type:complete
MSNNRKRGLGRGLDALFQDGVTTGTHQNDQTEQRSEQGRLPSKLPITELTPGQYQPRHHFDAEALQHLADSISEHGIVQPIVVRKLATGQYEIIAGERRWRAAQKAKLHDVPVVIKDMSDEAALEIALIENLQREDLSPLEEAEGYQRLQEEFSYTQENLAKKLGKSRSHVTNMLRLLKLPEKIKPYVQDGKISAGHARALLTCAEPELLASKIMHDGLSVRQTEKLAPTFGQNLSKIKKPAPKTPRKDVDTLALEKDLSRELGVSVTITPQENGKGTVSISYRDLDQLDNILEKLKS